MAIAVAGPAEALGPAHRRFDALVAGIAAERALLQAWDDALDRHRERVAREIVPAGARLREAQRALAFRLDALLLATAKGDRLRRRHHVAAQRTLLDLVAAMLEHGHEPELLALRDRHARGDRPMPGDAAGDGIEAGDAVAGAQAPDASVDAVLDRLMAQAEADSAERERGKAERRQARLRKQARARHEAAHPGEPQDASQAVREVFRRLASSLHPDREPDAAERLRKTALMQRANQAHARGDLLALLELQIETEQIDAGQLARVSAPRLKHYLDVLAGQLRTLEHEVRMRADPFGLDRRHPERLDKLTNAAMRDIHDAAQTIRAALAAIDDPAGREAWLDALADGPSAERGPSKPRR
jgi:hypothetical protein